MKLNRKLKLIKFGQGCPIFKKNARGSGRGGVPDRQEWAASWLGTNRCQKVSMSLKLTHSQCDQKKLPNVYKSCPKMISLEK